jgi:hypothetical protein
MNILKKSLYNIIRNYLKKSFTGNLGKVVEEDDRLVCYVKKGKCKRNKYDYTISCFGIMEKDKELANAYKLNKPICYIIDGIESERKKVYIHGYSNNSDSKCEVIVRNCRFNWDADIHVNGKCTLDNTYIRSFNLLLISAEDLIIENMNLDHKMKLAGSKYHISIGAKKSLIITWSNVGEIHDTVKVDLVSDNQLHIINSRVMGNEIKIKSPIIETNEDTSIVALEHTNIETDEFKKLKIDSPTTIFNGKDISEYGKTIELEKADDPLKNKRLALLEILKNIRNNCTKTADEMAENYKNNLNNQPVSKVLKK